MEYLTRLEQGRDSRPSPEILAALADALRLDDADRRHLQQLASVDHHRHRSGPGGSAARSRPTPAACAGCGIRRSGHYGWRTRPWKSPATSSDWWWRSPPTPTALRHWIACSAAAQAACAPWSADSPAPAYPAP